jgi:hypothetical protein
MQALAADFSGYAEDSAAVVRDKSSKQVVWIFRISITALTDGQRLFKSFLARNEPVAPGVT